LLVAHGEVEHLAVEPCAVCVTPKPSVQMRERLRPDRLDAMRLQADGCLNRRGT
jgi:hypothetical protein